MYLRISFRLLPVFLLLFFSLAHAEEKNTDSIVIENRDFRLVIGTDAKAQSLLHKPTGQECLAAGVDMPVWALTQYRPYDNENFLMFPAKPRVFSANKVTRENDELRVEFEDTYDIAVIGLNITDDYIGFTLRKVDYRIEKFGVKRQTEIDELTLLQLPIRKRTYFGEWLNVIWDEGVAVNVLATDPYARIDAFPQKEYITLYAGLDYQVKFLGVGAALITSAKDQLLDRIDRLEQDYQLPLGVQSRRCKEYLYSYYELRDVTVKNIDEHIAYAKQGGFRTMVVYYWDFAKSCGHFPWRDEYPNGMKDLQEVTRKIKEAGMIPGIHIHYSKAARNDPYLTPVPDARFNRVRNFTLAEAADEKATVLVVDENPEGCVMEDNRRLLQVGDELVTYTGFTTGSPYCFTGCVRGVSGSKAQSYAKGTKFGLLDVDTWPLFVRFDQNTSIQQEVAERLGEIYKEAGFRFVYFDGAEDVPMPYWYNVSRSQLTVYNELSPAPLFSEGALKSHFGWHILSRGNAFDIFPPEYIRPATRKYPMRGAKYIAQDFTSVNFGWIDYLAPGEKTIGMQPDMFEFICSRATAWNCPISFVGKLGDLRKHPRTADNLHVVKMWEDAKLQGYFSPEQKMQLQDPEQEHILLKDKKGNFELYPYRQILSDQEGPVRAFVFQKNGKTCIVYWHISGSGEITLEVDKRKITLGKESGQKVGFKNSRDAVILPVAGRLFLELDLPENEAVDLFRKAALALQGSK